MRLKFPSQPLVFCFSGVTALCSAVAKLYKAYPALKASLCLQEQTYYLAVYSRLKMRRSVYFSMIEYGSYLGPGRVIYSFYEEHGKRISLDAVAEIGAAMCSR